MKYVIVETREYYGPKTTRSLVADMRGESLTFQTREEAQAKIGELDSGRYYLAHNESSRPSYKVKSLG